MTSFEKPVAMRRMTFFVVPLFVAATVSWQCVARCEEPNSVHVVLLAGQSNMAGKGRFGELSPDDQRRIQAVSSRLMLSENGARAKPLGNPPAKPGKPGREASDRFGPEVFIVVTLAEANPNQEYRFVKYSMGGTSLYGAWSPEWSLEKSKAVEKGERKQAAQLYREHVKAIRKNIAELDWQGRPYKLIGMVWMQGENDAAKEISARSYEDNLKKLISAYRTEFEVPELPIVCGQINSAYGDFEEGPDMVRAAFVTVADADPNVAVIRTMKERPPTDFPKVDGAHYNTEGQKRLGTAMANVLMEMQ